MHQKPCRREKLYKWTRIFARIPKTEYCVQAKVRLMSYLVAGKESMN